MNGNKKGENRNKNEGKSIFFSSLIVGRSLNNFSLYANHAPDKTLPVKAKINIFSEPVFIVSIVRIKLMN